MRFWVAVILIAMGGAMVGATTMYLYVEFSPGPEPVAKQAAVPKAAPTATSEAPITPTSTPAIVPTPTAVPARTPGGLVPARIPFPSPVAQRTPAPRETATILNPRAFSELPDSSLLRRSDPDTYHAIARLRWVTDGISKMESDPAQSLIYLGLEAPESAREILTMSWLAGELSED